MANLDFNPFTNELDWVIDAAVDVGITDSGGYFTGTEVETALQEVGAFMVAENLWDRTGTVLTTYNAGDTVQMLDEQKLVFGTGNDSGFKFEPTENRLLCELINNAYFYLSNAFVDALDGSFLSQYKFALADTANNANRKIGLKLELTKT